MMGVREASFGGKLSSFRSHHIGCVMYCLESHFVDCICNNDGVEVEQTSEHHIVKHCVTSDPNRWRTEIRNILKAH